MRNDPFVSAQLIPLAFKSLAQFCSDLAHTPSRHGVSSFHSTFSTVRPKRLLSEGALTKTQVSPEVCLDCNYRTEWIVGGKNAKVIQAIGACVCFLHINALPLSEVLHDRNPQLHTRSICSAYRNCGVAAIFRYLIERKYHGPFWRPRA